MNQYQVFLRSGKSVEVFADNFEVDDTWLKFQNVGRVDQEVGIIEMIGQTFFPASAIDYVSMVAGNGRLAPRADKIHWQRQLESVALHKFHHDQALADLKMFRDMSNAVPLQDDDDEVEWNVATEEG